MWILIALIVAWFGLGKLRFFTFLVCMILGWAVLGVAGAALATIPACVILCALTGEEPNIDQIKNPWRF